MNAITSSHPSVLAVRHLPRPQRALLAAMVLDLAVSLRMIAYANSVEKPSVSGLKMELDRFNKDAEEHARSAKQDAEGFIAEVKAQREEGGEPDA